MNIHSKHLGRWSIAIVSLNLVAAHVLGCSESTDEDDEIETGTGGADSAAGGADSAAGGVDAATGGFACNGTFTGSGGAISSQRCAVSDANADPNPFEVECDIASGQGGASSYLPAWHRLCLAHPNGEFGNVTPIDHCVPNLPDVCDDDHEAALIECLSIEAPCTADLEGLGCAALINSCPELSPGVCFWGMSFVTETGASAVQDCFATERADETCDQRFLRCAWGI
jgi:hypothetical protein